MIPAYYWATKYLSEKGMIALPTDKDGGFVLIDKRDQQKTMNQTLLSQLSNNCSKTWGGEGPQGHWYADAAS